MYSDERCNSEPSSPGKIRNQIAKGFAIPKSRKVLRDGPAKLIPVIGEAGNRYRGMHTQIPFIIAPIILVMALAHGSASNFTFQEAECGTQSRNFHQLLQFGSLDLKFGETNIRFGKDWPGILGMVGILRHFFRVYPSTGVPCTGVLRVGSSYEFLGRQPVNRITQVQLC